MPDLDDVRVSLQRGYPWIEDFYPIRRRCRVRILMVADGLDFGSGGFGLDEFVSIVSSSTSPWVTHQVTTAHRFGGTASLPGNFRFDNAATPVTTANYDQVWLFGLAGESSPLSQAELQVIADFMNAGGGVFATGDHEDLGAGMCGEVPRVRSMRAWYYYNVPAGRPQAPPGGNEHRLDTLSIGHDPGFQFSDQSDDVPQRIYPRYYPSAAGTSSFPHPLLASPAGDVTVLPDHPHEGVCLVPASLTDTYDFGAGPQDEYPVDSVGNRASPEVIATSMSAAGLLTDLYKPPVVPQCFGAIGAYDGRPARVGRVVVDATWHHFVNINLNGTGSGVATKKGLYDPANNPTPDYLQIQRYFRNIVSWLTPLPVWRCWLIKWLPVVRYVYPLIEEVATVPEPEPDFRTIERVGRLVEATVAELASPAEAVELATAIGGRLGGAAPRWLEPMLDPWDQSATARNTELAGRLVADRARHGVLGGAVLALAKELPSLPGDAAKIVSRMGIDGIEKIVHAGADHAIATLRGELRHDVDRLTAMLDGEPDGRVARHEQQASARR